MERSTWLALWSLQPDLKTGPRWKTLRSALVLEANSIGLVRHSSHDMFAKFSGSEWRKASWPREEMTLRTYCGLRLIQIGVFFILWGSNKTGHFAFSSSGFKLLFFVFAVSCGIRKKLNYTGMKILFFHPKNWKSTLWWWWCHLIHWNQDNRRRHKIPSNLWPITNV